MWRATRSTPIQPTARVFAKGCSRLGWLATCRHVLRVRQGHIDSTELLAPGIWTPVSGQHQEPSRDNVQPDPALPPTGDTLRQEGDIFRSSRSARRSIHPPVLL